MNILSYICSPVEFSSNIFSPSFCCALKLPSICTEICKKLDIDLLFKILHMCLPPSSLKHVSLLKSCEFFAHGLQIKKKRIHFLRSTYKRRSNIEVTLNFRHRILERCIQIYIINILICKKSAISEKCWTSSLAFLNTPTPLPPTQFNCLDILSNLILYLSFSSKFLKKFLHWQSLTLNFSQF